MVFVAPDPKGEPAMILPALFLSLDELLRDAHGVFGCMHFYCCVA